MVDKNMLDLSDRMMKSLEDGTYQPRVVVVKPYPGYGILSVLTVNMANDEEVSRIEKQYGIKC